MDTSHRHLWLIAVLLIGCGPQLAGDDVAQRDDALLGVLQPKFIRSSKVNEPVRPAQLDGIAVDAHGNVFITGHFTTTLQFATGGAQLETAGGKDLFFGKYDAQGTEQWLRRYGDAKDQESFDLTLTPDGNEVILTGWFEGTLAFSSRPEDTLTSRGRYDGFIAKFTSGTGAPVWVRQLGSAEGDEGANEVEVDAQGNVIATAMASASFLYEGCPFPVTPSSDPTEEAGDAFVFKLNADGRPLWAFQTTGASNERIRGIGVVNTGAAVTGYVAGYQSRRATNLGLTTTFPSCATTRWNRALINPSRPNTRDWQGSVAALDVNGALKWHYALANDGGMTAVRATSGDSNGKAYFHGTVELTTTLLGRRVDDTVTTQATLKPAGLVGGELESQSVLAQVDFASGKVMWLNQFASNATDKARNAAMGGELDFSDGVLVMTGNRAGPWTLAHRYFGVATGLFATSPRQVLLSSAATCGFVSAFDVTGAFTSVSTPWSCEASAPQQKGGFQAGVVDAKGGFVAHGASYQGNLTYPQGTNALDAYDLPLGGSVFKWYPTIGGAETFTLLTLK